MFLFQPHIINSFYKFSLKFYNSLLYISLYS